MVTMLLLTQNKFHILNQFYENIFKGKSAAGYWPNKHLPDFNGTQTHTN